ncbi:MAG: ketoacyl-ACP synthase III [Deltaproteobacteria bacterium]|nr:ketoacyl-ACP synthase III [Candidatus Anaeroferrophillus wilburensis]MBN2888023.1 ketoacyl-ACP synthase III [Deltaproteobacteria bacterium]
MKHNVILGTGSAAPDNIVTNFDLEKIMDTSDEWITQRTGIKERRIALPGEKFSDFGLPASHQALKMAGIEATDLDMIIVGSLTPDTLMPSGGCTMQALLNADRAVGFDVCAACSGFVYGLAIADRFLKNDPELQILVVGGEIVSHHMDWENRNTAVLFGDGVGAAVVAARENQGAKILSVEMGSNGKLGDLLYFPGLGSAHPVGREDFRPEHNYIVMQGREIFKHAIKNMVEISGKAIQKAGISPDQITKIIPHQANLRIIEMLAKQFKRPLDQVFVNIDRYGNTSAGTIPIALNEANRSGFLEKGDLVLLTVFGGGLTWAAAVVEW